MNVSSVTNHYPTANKGFITTLGSTISAGAVTVPLTSVSGLTNGTVFVGLIEPGLANEQEFTGTVDTSGVQITGVKWTDGTNVDHTAGVTIVDYVSATGQNMQTKAHLVSHDQDGTLKAGAVDVTAVLADAIVTRPKLATAFASEFTTGWNTADLPAVNSVTANGNRSYDITFASTVASTLSSGMRLRTTRTVAAPTTCFSFDGVNDYYNDTSVAGMTFTDDFVAGRWIYLTSYAAAGIMSRYNGTSGWQFYLNASGQVILQGNNAGAGNNSLVTSYQSVPLNKWVFVAAQLDMSAFTATTTTSYITFDGKDVPSAVSRNGTNPTVLVQAGNLEVGSTNGGTIPFPGRMGGGFISSAKITQANILTLMGQELTAADVSTHSLVSAWASGSTTDLNTTNANNLTAQNGATTASYSPFGNNGTSSTLDYALVMSVSTSTATVQVPEGCTIPTSGGVTSVAYSVQGNPYGWVSDKGRWELTASVKTPFVATLGGVAGTFYRTYLDISVPTGQWNLSYLLAGATSSTAAGAADFIFEMSTSSSASTDVDLMSWEYRSTVTANIYHVGTHTRQKAISTAAATQYYGIVKTSLASNTGLVLRGDGAGCRVFALPSGL